MQTNLSELIGTSASSDRLSVEDPEGDERILENGGRELSRCE